MMTKSAHSVSVSPPSFSSTPVSCTFSHLTYTITADVTPSIWNPGFYALFSITESPLVESGTKWMGFHWKNGGDQLFARSGVLPEMSREALGGGEGEGSGTGTLTGNPWTRFSMDMRNVSPIEGPLDFAK